MVFMKLRALCTVLATDYEGLNLRCTVATEVQLLSKHSRRLRPSLFFFNASNNSSKNDRMSFGHEHHQGSSPLSAGSERGQWMIREPEHDHHQLLRGSSHLTPRSIDQFLTHDLPQVQLSRRHQIFCGCCRSGFEHDAE
jgi:hypothetical protein